MWKEQTLPAQRAKPRPEAVTPLSWDWRLLGEGCLETPEPLQRLSPLPCRLEPSPHAEAAPGWPPCQLLQRTCQQLPWRPASNQLSALLPHEAGRAKVAASCAQRDPARQGQAPGFGLRCYCCPAGPHRPHSPYHSRVTLGRSLTSLRPPGLEG